MLFVLVVSLMQKSEITNSTHEIVFVDDYYSECVHLRVWLYEKATTEVQRTHRVYSRNYMRSRTELKRAV